MGAKASGMRTVLLVEDSAPLCQQLRGLLGEAEGVCVVGQAGGAREAIAAVRALAPDVVVLDLHLAQGSGFDVLRAVRQDGDTRVIVLTNHGSVLYRRKALEAGADCFLDKSVEFDHLVAAVLGNDAPPAAPPGEPHAG